MAGRAEIVLSVPGLVERPAVGTSCCVTSAEALIAQELWMLPGVLDAQFNCRAGCVQVSYDPEVVTAEEIGAALGEVGYPPAEGETSRRSAAPGGSG
jgi:copper chaperone CopZ